MKLKLRLFIEITAKFKNCFREKVVKYYSNLHTCKTFLKYPNLLHKHIITEIHASPSRHPFKGELKFFCSASSYFQLTYFITHHSPEARTHLQLLQRSICDGKGIEIQSCTSRCYQDWLGWNRGAALPVPQPPAELMCPHLQMCPAGEVLQVGPLVSPTWSSPWPLALEQTWGCPQHLEQER